MMIKNYDQSVEINHNPNWLYILDHLHRILIISGSVSRKINVLLNLIKHQGPVVDKIIYTLKINPYQSIKGFLTEKKN